ncbi:hypothetical protein S40293_00945 [Stachybotrys chartarum IBT 40293]|nr:hypothetical protein S40293_00945 [Stachybotrys chartarum IBT 40293]
MADAQPSQHELDGDADEDEALRQAIALSLEEQHKTTAASISHEKDADKPTFGTLPLDRRQMEQERLQRLAKRRRVSSGDEVVEVPPPKKPAPSKPSSQSAAALPFPNGTIKRTWARGYPRTPDDIKIEEVLQKDQLILAVLSSFQWDEEWIMSKVNLATTKLLLLAFASDDAQKEAMRSNVPPGIKFCFPPMKGPGSMHSKLQVLKYPGYLRVVVPTGNLVPYDWGESGVMENMVFLIDLPRLENPTDHSPTMFSIELRRFLSASGVDDRMVSSLSNYDFSKTRELGFVYTIPGGHMDESLKSVVVMVAHGWWLMAGLGYCGLGGCVAALGLATEELVEVDLVCASLGSVNYDLVTAIYNACRGDDGMKEYRARTARKGSEKAAGLVESLKARFRIYFPTNQTVSRSRGGRSEKWWRSPTFPRELVRDCVNTRPGLLMHSKVILVRKPVRGCLDGPRAPGLAYVGSANLSESAWGRLVKDRASGKAKMSCRNWECGVVVPLPKVTTKGHRDGGNGGGGSGDRSATDSQVYGMDVFAGTVPIPMRVPGRHYEAGDQPWFFQKP